MFLAVPSAKRWRRVGRRGSFLLPHIQPLLDLGDDLALLVDNVDVEQRLDLPLPIGLSAQIRDLFWRNVKRRRYCAASRLEELNRAVANFVMGEALPHY